MKRGLYVLLLIGCMLIGMTACSDRQADEQLKKVILQERINEDLIYFSAELDLELNSEDAAVDFKVFGNNVYYPKEQSIVTYSTADDVSTADIYQWEGAPGEWAFERVCYNGAGEVYAVVRVLPETSAGTTYYFCKFSSERNLIFARDLAEYYREAGEVYDAISNKLEVGADDRIYLSIKSGIWIFEEDGDFADFVSFGNMKDVWVRDVQSDAKQNLYVLYEDNANQNQYVAEIDIETGALTAMQQTIGLTGISVQEDKLLGFNGATVYTYDRETFELTELFQWAECNVVGTTVYSAKQLLDGRILAATVPSWGGVESYLVKSILPDAGITSNPDKTIIRVAIYGSISTELEGLTMRFNKNSEMYEVVLDNYGPVGDKEGLARLKGELAAGKGPDLIDMDFGVRSMVENMYLEDLSLWLSESGEISEGDFVDFATETYKIEGTLAAIPHRFDMTLTLGNAEVIGEEAGWTMEEYLDFLGGQGGSSVHALGDTNAKDVCREILRLNSGYFMDMDACTCNFDNDIFRKMVEVLKDYPLEYDYAAQGIGDWLGKLENGNAVLDTVSIQSFTSLQKYDRALGDNLNCIGLPVEEGVGVWAVMYDAFGISTFSENKEGAWEFLEEFLQCRLSDPRLTCFTTYVPSLEVYADWFMNQEDLGKWKDGDVWRDNPIPVQEEIDRCMELIELAQPGFNEFRMINDIIIPEMGDYYAGKTTMDEMIASIEGRVELYLKEHR